MERKLTAILSADVEGYSRLMGEDEEATIRTLTSYREVMTPLIRVHRGRVVDSPGDNLLAEFGSVVDAVQCAVVIQTTLRAENANLPEHRRMEFRIGINLGDVVVDGERIYGDGLNIAARVEGLAEAYGEAVRHLQQALRTQEVLDPDDKAKRCDLLLCQAEAMLPQEEPYRVADTVAAEAFALAEEREDSPRAARAAVQACDALMRKGYSGTGTAPAASPEFQEWAARADRHAPSGSIERIYSDLYLGLATMQTGGPAASHVHYRRAANLALKLDDSAAFFAAASWAVARLNALRDYELRGRVAAEALRRPREGARARDLSIVLSHSALTVFNRGDRPAAEKAWGELRQLAERTRDVNAELGALGDTAVLAFADGRLEETRSLHDSISARAEALGVEMTGLGGGVLVLLDARARYFLGESVEPMLATVSGPGRVTQARRAVILSCLGRGAEMRAIRERFGDVGADTDESAIFNLVNLLEASLGVGDAETAGALMRRLAPLAGYLSLRTGDVSIGRLAGEAAALLGQPEAAHGYYAQALEVCERVRFRPEIALTRFDLAELLLQGTPEEKAQAREHLEFAIGEFREMKMKPALERALGHKQVLKA